MNPPTPPSRPGQPEVLGEVVITIYDTDPRQSSISVTAADGRLTTDDVEELALRKLEDRRQSPAD